MVISKESGDVMLGVLIFFACQDKGGSDALTGDSERGRYAVDCVGLSLEDCPEECNIFTGIPEIEDSEGNTCIDLEMEPQPQFQNMPQLTSRWGFAEDDDGRC